MKRWGLLLIITCLTWLAPVHSEGKDPEGPWYVDGGYQGSLRKGSQKFPFVTLEEALPEGSCPAAGNTFNSYWKTGDTIFVKGDSVIDSYNLPHMLKTIEVRAAGTPPYQPSYGQKDVSVIVPAGLRIIGTNSAWAYSTPPEFPPVIDITGASIGFHGCDGYADTINAKYLNSGAVSIENLVMRGIVSSRLDEGYFHFVLAGNGITINNVQFEDSRALFSSGASLTMMNCTLGNAAGAEVPTYGYRVVFDGIAGIKEYDSEGVLITPYYAQHPLVVKDNIMIRGGFSPYDPNHFYLPYWLDYRSVELSGNLFDGTTFSTPRMYTGACLNQTMAAVNNTFIGFDTAIVLRPNGKHYINANQFIDCNKGIYVPSTGGGSARVTNNLFLDNGVGFYPISNSPRQELANNNFIGNITGAVLSWWVEGDYWNNIFLDNETAVSIGDGTRTHIGYNLYYGNTSDFMPTTYWCGVFEGDVCDNPLLDNDLIHLTIDSPAIGMGAATLDYHVTMPVEEDFDGDPRPLGSGWDIGMDEYY